MPSAKKPTPKGRVTKMIEDNDTERRANLPHMSATLDALNNHVVAIGKTVHELEHEVQKIQVAVAEISGRQHGDMQVLTQRVGQLEEWRGTLQKTVTGLVISTALLFLGATVSFGAQVIFMLIKKS